MARSWCQVASNLDNNHKIRRAGRNGREVYLFALRLNAEPNHATPGFLPAEVFEDWYLADRLMMPLPDAADGVASCLRAKLIRMVGETYEIIGWDEVEWGRNRRSDSSTERVREWRKRNAGNADETLRNVSETGNVSGTKETGRGEERRGKERIGDHTDPDAGAGDGMGALSPGDPGDVRDSQVDQVWEAETSQDAARRVQSRNPTQEAPPIRKGAQKASQGRSQQSTGAIPIREAIPEPLPPPEAATLAQLLLDYVCRNSPSSRLARSPERALESTAHRWGHEIKRMNGIDGRQYAEIFDAIHWTQRDPWWRTTVLSAESLRTNFDRIQAQRKRAKPGDPSVADPAVERERAAARKLEQEKQSAIERARADQVAADRDEVTAGLAEVKQKLGIVP